MIHRFDHCVVAAHDLKVVQERYADALGLAVYPGGRHTGLGTENAIIRFGLDYLELLSVYNEEEVRRAGPRRSSLLDYLTVHSGGLVGFCLAAQDLHALAERFDETNLSALGPFAMQRRRPDGSTLDWELLVPGGLSWRKPWPFFIRWGLADDVRLQIETPGQHEIGAVRIGAVRVLVSDLDAADKLYRDQMGLDHDKRAVDEVYQTETSIYYVGRDKIILLAPRPESELSRSLSQQGEGLWEVQLDVPNLEPVMREFSNRQVPFMKQPGPSLLIEPDFLWGTRLRWNQKS